MTPTQIPFKLESNYRPTGDQPTAIDSLIKGLEKNIIAIHNVVSATTVVGLANREGIVMRKLIIPTICYVLLAIIIGFVIINTT